MTAPQHPQRCWTCTNKDCPFYAQRGYLTISSEDRDTGIRVSEMTPAEFSSRFGCASHSSAGPVPEPCKGCTDKTQCYVPCKEEQHDAEVALAERERWGKAFDAWFKDHDCWKSEHGNYWTPVPFPASDLMKLVESLRSGEGVQQ